MMQAAAAGPRIGQGPIEIPGRLHPVLALTTFVPVLTIIMISLVLAVEVMPPIPLLILLLLVVGCCLMLVVTSLQVMLGGKITMDQEGLTISRLLSEDTYPWASLDACKVTPGTGTFGDDALVEVGDRVGLGLFLRGSKRERDHDLDADVIVCASDKADVQTMMQIANKIQAGIKRASEPVKRGPARAPQRGRPQFMQRPGGAPARRPGAPAPAAPRRASADPVAQFRGRANKA